MDGSGSTEYYIQDQLGSTRGLLDASGTVVGSSTYTPYGEVKGHSGASTPFGYAGQYTDSESGLQYLRARYYDPSTAQFLTLDPLLGATMEPYGYAGGDGLNAIDPSGLACAGLVPLPFTGDSWSSCRDTTGAAVYNAVSGLFNSAAQPVYSTASPAQTTCYAAQAQAAGTGSEADTYQTLALMLIPGGTEADAGEAGVTVLYARFWPASAAEMDNLLGFRGTRLPDTPNTPGRNKVVWRPSEDIEITGEKHNYGNYKKPGDVNWHWHLDIPKAGIIHRRYMPGQQMLGF